jgi:hypothetical protein
MPAPWGVRENSPIKSIGRLLHALPASVSTHFQRNQKRPKLKTGRFICASEMGDSRWRESLGNWYMVMRKELSAFRGREVDTAGDGLLATFDGPARAIRCACSMRERVRALGLQVRTGLHTGECELVGDGVVGIAVHIGARVASVAAPDEVLVSRTVKDLVAGSGLKFGDRGAHSLKASLMNGASSPSSKGWLGDPRSRIKNASLRHRRPGGYDRQTSSLKIGH